MQVVDGSAIAAVAVASMVALLLLAGWSCFEAPPPPPPAPRLPVGGDDDDAPAAAAPRPVADAEPMQLTADVRVTAAALRAADVFIVDNPDFVVAQDIKALHLPGVPPDTLRNAAGTAGVALVQLGPGVFANIARLNPAVTVLNAHAPALFMPWPGMCVAMYQRQ